MATHDRLRALVDLARTLSASLDLDDVLRRVAGHATAVTGSSACSVSLWDRERDSLVTLTGWFGQIAGEMDAGQEEFLLSDFPASRDVLERQQTRLIRVANEADDPSERTLLAAEGYASLLMIPLVSRGRCLGLMEIVDESDRLWDDADLDFFRTLADIISAAVHNAVLRKQSTEAEERYRTLVENLPAVTYLDIAGTGQPVYVSPQVDSLMGVARAEWEDGPDGWTHRLHPDDRAAVERYEHTVRTGEPFSAEYRLVADDGRVRWFRDDAVAVRDQRGEPRFIQGVIFEVTNQKQAEAALRESEQRFRELLENVRLAAVATDAAGRIEFVNDYLAELTGWRPAELVGRTWLEAFTPPGEREAETEVFTLLGSGTVVAHRESSLLTRAGAERLFSWNSTPLRDPDGRVIGATSLGEDITERRRAEQELHHLAYHDPLTGLPNRILFHEHLDVALERAKRADRGVAVLYVDLDDFKLVNDSFGHSAGDQLLCEVARRLRAATRSTDVVARQGGDEFLILVADLDVDEGAILEDVEVIARRVAEHVRQALTGPMILADTEVYTSGSIGISLYPLDAADGESLLKHADIAMYRAKESGRDGYEVFASTGLDPRVQISMAGRLRRAVERRELTLHYQPLVALHDGVIVGAEALLRWTDGDRGLVMPGEFIPLAERTGLIGPISDWVIEEACRQGAAWREAGMDLYVSVNLPAVFWQPTAMRQVLDTIESFGLSADRMMIEITESTVMADAGRSQPIIAELHHRGLRLAIDDFGTGHSSLARLNQMKVTTLKIDRSFIAGLPHDESASVLVASIVQLARNLGLEPLAEGVETEQQRAFLVEHGCSLGQGFLFSKAVPAAQLELLYRSARREAA